MNRTILACLVALALAPGLLQARQPGTAAVVESNTRFALELYGQLRAQKGNLFLSPFSISTALAMTSAGARGKTLAQMEKVLHLLPPKKHHPAQGDLLDQVHGLGAGKRGFSLCLASALWGQKGQRPREDFLELTRTHYGAGLREVDFLRDPEGARRAINAWVGRETQERIKEVLRPGTVKKDTRLMLTNAIYFKGDWANRFDRSATRSGTFHLAGGGSSAAALMSQKGTFGYLDGGTFQALELPYTARELSMVVLLPRRVDGLAALEKMLAPAKLAGWLKGLKKRAVMVTLPRFKVSSASRLNGVLGELGMPLAFNPKAADFSGLGKGQLQLSAVVHQAFVEVNEEGSEAAASTAVKVVGRAATVPSFRADRPFVFLIRDLRNGSILFLGRLVTPK
jgi:serpin B